MKKLIVTADDFGFTKSINEGIIRSVKDGIVTDVAVMVLTDEPDLTSGVELLKENRIESLGLHTSLFSFGKKQRPGRSDYIKFFKESSDRDIEDVAMKEISKYENIFGRSPDFISPQYNMHGNLRLLKILAKYCVDKKIPMRVPRAVLENDEIEDKNYAAEVYLKRLGVKMTDHLFVRVLGSSATQNMTELLDELKQVKDGETTELVFHPGFFDQDILEGSSLNFERTRDLEITLNIHFKQEIEKMGFTLSCMSEL